MLLHIDGILYFQQKSSTRRTSATVAANYEEKFSNELFLNLYCNYFFYTCSLVIKFQTQLPNEFILAPEVQYTITNPSEVVPVK